MRVRNTVTVLGVTLSLACGSASATASGSDTLANRSVAMQVSVNGGPALDPYDFRARFVRACPDDQVDITLIVGTTVTMSWTVPCLLGRPQPFIGSPFWNSWRRLMK